MLLTRGVSRLHCLEQGAARRQVCCLTRHHHRRSLGTRPAAMASREVVSTTEAPAALGPYSQAIAAQGTTLFISGQLGLVPGEKSLEGKSVEAQAEQVLKNLGAILKEKGASYGNVVKTTVLLADMGDFAAVNGVYGTYFKDEPPARACYAVKTLPLNALVEIEAVAVL